MGLANLQIALIQLTSCASDRDSFWKEQSSEVISRLGLTTDEVNALRIIPLKQIAITSQGFSEKRWSVIQRRWPLTMKIAKTEVRSWYMNYAEEHPLLSSPGDNAEAKNFLRYLADHPYIFRDTKVPWLIELLTYETIHSTRPRLRIAVFPIKLCPLLSALRNNEQPSQITVRPSVAVWWRFGHNGRFYHYITS